MAKILELQHPVNIQDWFPLGLTGLISLLSKGLSRVFSSITIRKHHFFGALITPRSQHKLLKVCIVSCSGWFVQQYLLNTYYVPASLLDTWKDAGGWDPWPGGCWPVWESPKGQQEPESHSWGLKVKETSWGGECVLASGWAAWFREWLQAEEESLSVASPCKPESSHLQTGLSQSLPNLGAISSLSLASNKPLNLRCWLPRINLPNMQLYTFLSLKILRGSPRSALTPPTL